MLETFDVLVYDIQDVGSRYYTFLSPRWPTSSRIAPGRASGWWSWTAPTRWAERSSRANLAPRYGEALWAAIRFPLATPLTIGEFAQMVNAEQHFGCGPTVVPCTGWQRGQRSRPGARRGSCPAPTSPTTKRLCSYVGTCLFEGTITFRGPRQWAAPSAVIGAPYIHDAEALAAAFNARGPPGYLRYAVLFYPRRSPNIRGQLCGGVHLHVLDADAARPLSAGLTLLELIRDTCPNDFWPCCPQHTEGRLPFISLLAGHRELKRPTGRRRSLSKPSPGRSCFAARKAAYHLY